MRRLIFVFLAASAVAQQFIPEKVVFPITDFKPDIQRLSPLTIKFGTGFCLDPECRFVGTNYHVAKIMGKYVRIQGVFSAHRYLNSAPDDEGAQEITLAGGGSLKYTPAHDLAIYEMRHPLKNLHGISFDGDEDELANSPNVDIYSYPFQRNPMRRMTCWHGKFIGKTPDGLFAFSYEEGQVRGGASGGIVVASSTKRIVGILSGWGATSGRVALAVPVKELADFVTRAQPYLQATLFPSTVFVSPVAADLYPPYVWPHVEGFSPHTVSTLEVFKLRQTAQHLADSLRNFTATQTFAWGHDNREPDSTDAYETLIVDGQQRWRRPGSQKFYNSVPFPPLYEWVVPGGVWSGLPQMIGTEFDLRIRQAPDAVVGARTVHVFQYAANAEDAVCSFAYLLDFVLFQRLKSKFYDCHGEVWMDESGTILRISEALDLTGPSHHYWAVVTYGWLEKDGIRHLVPLTTASQLQGKKIFWCRGLFTDYGMFGVKTHLLMPPDPEEASKVTLVTQ